MAMHTWFECRIRYEKVITGLNTKCGMNEM